jgi:hypothetical protein
MSTTEIKAPQEFRDELLEALLGHAATLPRRDRPRARARRLARLVPPIAVAVVATTVLILRSGGAVAPQPATAAGVLRASATALDRLGGSRALGPNDYFYTRIAAWWRYAGSPYPYVVRSIQQEWLARDGRGRSRYEVVGLSGLHVNRSFPLARSMDTRLPRHKDPFIISTLPSPGILLSYAQLRRLPTDPTRLAAALNSLAARYHVNQLFPQAGYRAAIRFGILRGLAEAPTSAALRAALYRVLAATPGIRLLGRTRDSIGRYGMAVAIDVHGVELEMIIDPTTGALLQTSRWFPYRSRPDPAEPPGLNYRVTFLASGIVTSTRARIR